MRRLFFFIFILFFAVEGLAQGWPSRPIRMVIPLSPGGFADVPGRILAARLSSLLGYNVFVENRPGAGGTIGADFVAKSAPDGYTLLFTGTPHVISAWVYKKLPYDPLKDFEPVALVASGPYVLVVNPQLPVHSVRELIAAAKAQPGKIDYASSGNGSAQHLVSALFASMAGIELNHVPYKGSGPAMQDLLGGQVKVSFAGIPNVLPHVKAGRLRALAVSTPQRSPDLPDVPTAAEAGVPGYQATLWLNLAAPAGTPGEIVQRLYAETAKALQDAELQQNFRAAGVEASPMSPQELAGFMRGEFEKWGRVVRDTGATVN
ncbi:MAG: tripartite tricarboxylate transporter substrate binding protein [Betaproteobacteria bacterium]|nr:MAG: tripartite tricarboxylate transporter substrate binding protein [Betaproteobacteria bacterium]